MAPQFFFTSSYIVLLLLSLSSLYYICDAHYSPSSKKPSSTLHSLKSLNGTKKGDHVKGLSRLKKYLASLGYIDQKPSTTPLHRNNDFFDDTLESAIEKYQQFYHLKTTGILDQETLQLLSQPRCGVPDFQSHVNLSSSLHNVTNIGSLYSLLNLRWPLGKTELTYSFPRNFRDDAYLPVVESINKWMRATGFFFKRIRNFADADIQISFESGDHGCTFSFRQADHLAHALPPTEGKLHFNADKSWKTNEHPEGQHDLQTVALHELGHVMGLGHSNIVDAAMYPYLDGRVIRELHDDDIRGIRAQYHEYYDHS